MSLIYQIQLEMIQRTPLELYEEKAHNDTNGCKKTSPEEVVH